MDDIIQNMINSRGEIACKKHDCEQRGNVNSCYMVCIGCSLYDTHSSTETPYFNEHAGFLFVKTGDSKTGDSGIKFM